MVVLVPSGSVVVSVLVPSRSVTDFVIVVDPLTVTMSVSLILPKKLVDVCFVLVLVATMSERGGGR